MDRKIQVLSLKIDNFTTKDAVKRVMSYMKTEPLNVVEMITMNTIGIIQQDETAATLFESFDLALSGDKGILEAAGVTDERHLKEVDELLFVKMMMRFFHKNEVRVFLLASNHADLQKIERYIREDYSHIQVVEMATLEDGDISDDKILNLMNAAEAQCILSALPSPIEEQFVSRTKGLINARVWMGFGNLLDELKKEKTGFEKVKDFILRQILKKEVAKKGENA